MDDTVAESGKILKTQEIHCVFKDGIDIDNTLVSAAGSSVAELGEKFCSIRESDPDDLKELGSLFEYGEFPDVARLVRLAIDKNQDFIRSLDLLKASKSESHFCWVALCDDLNECGILAKLHFHMIPVSTDVGSEHVVALPHPEHFRCCEPDFKRFTELMAQMKKIFTECCSVTKKRDHHCLWEVQVERIRPVVGLSFTASAFWAWHRILNGYPLNHESLIIGEWSPEYGTVAVDLDSIKPKIQCLLPTENQNHDIDIVGVVGNDRFKIAQDVSREERGFELKELRDGKTLAHRLAESTNLSDPNRHPTKAPPSHRRSRRKG